MTTRRAIGRRRPKARKRAFRQMRLRRRVAGSIPPSFSGNGKLNRRFGGGNIHVPLNITGNTDAIPTTIVGNGRLARTPASLSGDGNLLQV